MSVAGVDGSLAATEQSRSMTAVQRAQMHGSPLTGTGTREVRGSTGASREVKHGI